MTILSVAELREHLPLPSLGDDAVQRLLDDAEAAIVGFAGAAGERTELIDGRVNRICLAARAASITSVTETHGLTDTVLAADDYRIRADGYVLERLTGGTHTRSYWDRLVTVVYTPADDAAQREACQIALVQHDVNTGESGGGTTRETIGSWTEETGSSTSASHTARDQRASILAAYLRPDGALPMVVGG